MLARQTVAAALAFPFIVGLAGQPNQSSRGTSESARPRTVEDSHSGHAISDLPIVVDGARDPERIADELAYRHFIMAIAVRAQNAEPRHLAQRTAQLDRVGFSDRDKKALVDALLGVREELDTLQLSRVQSESPADINTLKAREHELLDEARRRLSSALTANGQSRLETYVREHVKRRIVIYGELPRQ